MTHLGDNPFQNNGGPTISDEELAVFLDDETNRSLAEQMIDLRGAALLARIQTIADKYDVDRLFDESSEVTDQLDEARLEVLRGEIAQELIDDPESQAAEDVDRFYATVEYRSNMALIRERRFQQALVSRAMRLTDLYEHANGYERPGILEDIEYEKKIYIALLMGHYGFKLSSWPAAFDEMTPGTAIGLDVDQLASTYKAEADAAAKQIVAKEKQESDERTFLSEYFDLDQEADFDRYVEVMTVLAVIQEEVDIITMFDEPNKLGLIGEIVWDVGSRGGFTSLECKKIAAYYETKHRS